MVAERVARECTPVRAAAGGGWVGACRALLWGGLTAAAWTGCAADPLNEVAWAPEGPSTWYRMELGGAMIGVEERARLGDGGWARRRLQRVRVGGTVMDWVEGETAHPGSEGLTYRSLVGDRAAVVGPPTLDWLGGPGSSGAVRLPYGTVVEGEVVRVEENGVAAVAVWWDGPVAGATFDGEGLWKGQLGAVSWHRVDGRPLAWDPVDVHALLSRSAPLVDRPRRRRIGRFRVDGVAVEVDTPLDGELPHLALPARGEASEELQAFVDRAVASTDLVEAVRELSAAVDREVRDAPRGGRASGMEVLAVGEGDCTEHTALFLDAAAGLGLDARPVAGLLYLSDGAVGPGLYPHAWAEVRIGNRWVAVDPTLGTFPADAARVPLGRRVDRAMDRLAQGTEVVVVTLR